MATQTNIIEENLIVRDGQATSALGRIASKVGGIGRAFAGVRTVLGGAAGLAGLYGVAQSVAGVTQLYEKVGRLRAITGLAAQDIHALDDAMDLTGSGDAAEKVITRLAAVQQRARGGSKEAQKLQQSLARVGVSMKGGVDQAFLSMATAVQKGKLGIADMARTFKIPLAQAGQVMKTLEQGPGRLKKIMNETKNGADVVDEAALASFEKMQQGKRELKDAWDGLVGTIKKKLTPGITDLFNKMTQALIDAGPIVEKIGGFLADHMNAVVASAKLYLAYLVAAKAVETASGGKQTLGGWAKNMITGGGAKSAGGDALKDIVGKVASKVMGGGGKGAAVGRGLPSLSAGFGAVGREIATRRAVGTILPGTPSAAISAMGKIGPIAGKITSLLPVIRSFGAIIGRFGPVGIIIATAIGVISAMYRMLSKDVDGHASRLKKLFSDFAVHAKSIWSVIKPVIGLVKEVFGFWFEKVASSILWYVRASMVVINGTIQAIKAIGYFIGELFSSPVYTARHMGQVWADSWFKAGPDSEMGRVLPGQKKKVDPVDPETPRVPPANNQDFRGSTFNINQAFAEGFDPGRMASVITDDIAVTADRRRQSGFAPLYAIGSAR